MRKRRVHQALLSEPLFKGVPRRLLMFELILVALPFQQGFSFQTFAAAAFWGVVVHSLFRLAHVWDPQAFEILGDQVQYHRHYCSQALVHSPPRRVPWRSIKERSVWEGV